MVSNSICSSVDVVVVVVGVVGVTFKSMWRDDDC